MADGPRVLRSRSTESQDCFLSCAGLASQQYLLAKAELAPTMSNSAALRSEIPAFRYNPSAHQYTSSSCDKSAARRAVLGLPELRLDHVLADTPQIGLDDGRIVVSRQYDGHQRLPHRLGGWR